MIGLAPPSDWPVIAVMALLGLWCWRVSLCACRRVNEERNR